MFYRIRTKLIVFVVGAFGLFVGRVWAADAQAFLSPFGWSVGDPNSTYQEWDNFSSRTGNVPDVGKFPLHFNPLLSAASPALKTGTNNLYGFARNWNWWADIPNYGGSGPGTHVLVQIAASLYNDVGVVPGTLAIVQPDGSPIPGGGASEWLQNTTLFQGQVYSPATDGWATTRESLWEFYLTGYTGDFRVVGTNAIHSSLLAVRVDSLITEPVPEPGTAALGGFLLVAIGAVRLVRRYRGRETMC